jgi:hypothetical protein
VEPEFNVTELLGLGGLVDRASLRELLDRYCFAIDRGDVEAFRSCWTTDAYYEMNDRGSVWKTLVGQDEIVAFFDVRYFSNPSRRTTNHAISSTNLVINGHAATGETMGVAHVLDGPVERGRMMIRGIRYLDDFVRQPEGWRILRRRHLPVWQYDVPTVPADIAPQPMQVAE